jgi:protein TonB
MPSRRALLAAGVAFTLGLLLFLALWLDQRSSNDFYRSAPTLPHDVAGQEFEPLPAPLPASDRGSVAPEVEEDEDTRSADGEEPSPGIAPMQVPMPLPEPVEAPPAPLAGPTSLPRPIQQPAPHYPRDAYRRRESGTVLLRVHVDARGEPGEVDLVSSSGSRSLDRAASDAVRRWRFAPAMRGETPVDGVVQVPIDFSLGR